MARPSPEELIAAAHSSCFSMALSHGLTEAGHRPSTSTCSATVTLDRGDGAPTVTTSELTVTGRVPGIDQAGFRAGRAERRQELPDLARARRRRDHGQRDARIDYATGCSIAPSPSISIRTTIA